MGFISIIGYLSTLNAMIEIGEDGPTIFDRFLSVVTIAVPPALPAAMSSGVAFAISRLRLNKIYCIQPNRLNVSGTITTIVFDKTGTITEEGLTVLGCRVVNDDATISFSEMKMDAHSLDKNDESCVEILNSKLFLQAMASCTSITYVNDKLIGDPLDIEMFKFTGWMLEEPEQTENDDNVI